jgi:putative salt-induced outer membrane protein
MRIHPRAFLFALISLAATSAVAESTAPRSLFSVTGEPTLGFSSESELGLSLISGNTDSNRISLRNQTSYRWEEETLQAQGRYLKSEANDVENAQNWALGARYERRLVPRLGLFLGQSLEADRFAGFRQRYATDLGLRHTHWRSPRSSAASELGYRYQVEHRVTEQTVIGHILRAYFEMASRLNANWTGLFSIEALPDVKNGEDWMTNVDLAVQSGITSRLALKTSYSFRYDNRPAGPERIDRVLTTSLVAKF